jgi:hypothetical protein
MIDKLKCNFPNISFIKADDEIADWKQMLLMSCCNNNIIANSTFSWWGAYSSLAKKKGNPIYVPSRWILYNVPQEDIYSSWMTRI